MSVETVACVLLGWGLMGLWDGSNGTRHIDCMVIIACAIALFVEIK